MNSSINKNLVVKIMGKKLSETTLEELWKLFPIYLTEHQSCWQKWYSEEEGLLKNALPSVKRISHIGSTRYSFYLGKAYRRYSCGNSGRKKFARLQNVDNK